MDSKAYKVFLPNQCKTVVSRDVKFEENLASRKSQDLQVRCRGITRGGSKDRSESRDFQFREPDSNGGGGVVSSFDFS
jgi:hypothetical protein